MGYSKKISKLLNEKVKANDEVRRIHKLIFNEAKSDNVEMRILWEEYDKAKKQLVAINEEIEQLRQKNEVKAAKSKGVTPKSTVEETATEEGKTVVAKEGIGTQEIIRLVDYPNKNVDKPVKKPTESAQPSVKPEGNNNLEKATKVVKPKDEGEDKKTEDKNEGKKTEEDIKIQPELDNDLEKGKPQRVQERVKIKGISIRVPKKEDKEPKPIIHSERYR